MTSGIPRPQIANPTASDIHPMLGTSLVTHRRRRGRLGSTMNLGQSSVENGSETGSVSGFTRFVCDIRERPSDTGRIYVIRFLNRSHPARRIGMTDHPGVFRRGQSLRSRLAEISESCCESMTYRLGTLFLNCIISPAIHTPPDTPMFSLFKKEKKKDLPERKSIFVSGPIQGRLSTRLVFYWVLYHFVLWHALFAYRYVEFRMANRLPDVSFRELYGDFVLHYYPIVLCAVSMLPIFIIDLVRLTHRIAGPLVQFQRRLKQMTAGEPGAARSTPEGRLHGRPGSRFQ